MKNKRMFKCVNSDYSRSWPFELGREYELSNEHAASYEFKLKDDQGLAYYFTGPKECFEEVKNIIGYKLVKPEYWQAASIIVWNKYIELHSITKGVHFENNSIGKHLLEEAGVLDLWFEPVYEETVKIPKVHGLELEVKGDKIHFGKRSLSIQCFNSIDSTQIRYICLEKDRFFIGVSEMNEIREYLKKI